MTAEIKIGQEKIVVKDGQNVELGGVIFFSQKSSTWVHPVSEDNVHSKVGAVKIKVVDKAVGLHKVGSSVGIAGLTVEHI